MILIIKERFGAFSALKNGNEIYSVTQMEYNTAKKIGIPIFVFVHQSSFDEFQNNSNSDKKSDYNFSKLENKYLADFINSIVEDKSFRYI